MSIIEFTSPMLNKVVTDLSHFGYNVTHQQEGYDQQGNNVVTKVLFCERNQLQVLIQATKIPTVVDNEDSSQPESGSPLTDITANTAVDTIDDTLE